MNSPRSLQLARFERPVRYLLVLLLMSLAITSGCATHTHALDPASAGGLTPTGGLQPTTSGGEVALFIYAGVALVLVGAFVVDLLLLPFAAHHHDMAFPCCQALLHACH